MCHYREDRRQAGDREADRRRAARDRGHLGSRPRGNPELDRRDFERSVEKLSRVIGR